LGFLHVPRQDWFWEGATDGKWAWSFRGMGKGGRGGGSVALWLGACGSVCLMSVNVPAEVTFADPETLQLWFFCEAEQAGRQGRERVGEAER
jgi:hypothetical protein